MSPASLFRFRSTSKIPHSILASHSFSINKIRIIAGFNALLPVSWAKEAVPVAEDPEVERRMIDFIGRLALPRMPERNVAGSRADFANDLRREIREQMKANKSDKEIVDFLVARYGDFVLYRPPVKSTTLFLWFGPFIFLLVGATYSSFISSVAASRLKNRCYPNSNASRLKPC